MEERGERGGEKLHSFILKHKRSNEASLSLRTGLHPISVMDKIIWFILSNLSSFY